jgi:hypothetical protein
MNGKESLSDEQLQKLVDNVVEDLSDLTPQDGLFVAMSAVALYAALAGLKVKSVTAGVRNLMYFARAGLKKEMQRRLNSNEPGNDTDQVNTEPPTTTTDTR